MTAINSAIDYVVEDGIAVITVDSPPVNAMSVPVMDGLHEAFTRALKDDAVTGAVLICGGRTFIAGADLKSLSDPNNRPQRDWGEVQHMLVEATKPVVSAIHGTALGGGMELAMFTNSRVAVPSARMGLTEVKLGLLPGYGGTVRLPRIVGKGRALELLLTGSIIDAAEAFRIGLVSRVVPADRLLDEAEAFARNIMEQGPLAVRSVLEAVDAGYEMSQEDALLLEANLFGLLSSTDDMREGTRAFLEKRKPAFEGH